MDVRNIRDIAPEMEHQGTRAIWWFFKPRELFEQTKGGHLELIDVWEVAGGGEVHPHKHPTWEFYYVTDGRGMMVIEDERREIGPGDLVLIPPDAVHSISPVSRHAPIRCFCFAVGVEGSPAYDYSHDYSKG
jgi:mannose-6-phosphate isomerase-like protein (cupin superfamily)